MLDKVDALIDSFFMNTYRLLLSCPDQKGIIAKITESLYQLEANILDLDQHCSEDDAPQFFMRLEFVTDTDSLVVLKENLLPLMTDFSADYRLVEKDRPLRAGILLSKEDHCLQEILYQWRAGTLPIEITGIYANHDSYQELADWMTIPFHYIPYDDKTAAEAQLLKLTTETDLVIMARFMQILSAQFLEDYARPVVNIHHSFLPSFKGANPYRQAFDRGVKLIGATAHFASSDLDEGPIITQKVTAVTHRHHVSDLKEMGKTLEKQCLLEAIQKICAHKVIRYGNKTIVF